MECKQPRQGCRRGQDGNNNTPFFGQAQREGLEVQIGVLSSWNLVDVPGETESPSEFFKRITMLGGRWRHPSGKTGELWTHTSEFPLFIVAVASNGAYKARHPSQ